MSDTIESLDNELRQQKALNDKLLDLLRRIEGALPDPNGKIGPMIDETLRTKQILDDCQNMIEQKKSAP